MAKKIKKATAAAPAAGLLRGKLPKGEGAIIKRAFHTRMANSGATNLPDIPEAVCFTVSELRAFLDSAEKTVNPNPSKPVPANEIGVAIMPAYRNNKITFMLVATRFKEDKPSQKVLSINNPITGIHRSLAAPAQMKAMKLSAAQAPGDPDPLEPPVDDNTYDTGSTYP
jgi:hypothetical protein